MQLELKPVPSDDLDRLRRISIETFTEAFAPVNTQANMNAYVSAAFNSEKLARELSNPDSRFFYCHHNTDVIGYMKLNFAPAQTDLNDPSSLELERIYVLREHQNKKAGMFMIGEAMAFARQNKLSYIWLGVWDQNHHAIRFYERNGFVRVSEHPFMLGDERQTDIIMKLQLD